MAWDEARAWLSGTLNGNLYQTLLDDALARPARLISCTNRIYKNCGLNDLEQIEDAPEYDPNVVLTAELVKDYLTARASAPA